jgi:hypothetical protein
MGQAEKECQDRTTRTGLPAQDCSKKRAMAGQKRENRGKDSQNRTARTRQPGTIQPERDSQNGSQNRTTRTVQPDRTDKTGLPALHCQKSTAWTGHLEQDSQDMVAGTGQPEKESLNRTDQIGQAKQDKKMMICRSEMSV